MEPSGIADSTRFAGSERTRSMCSQYLAGADSYGKRRNTTTSGCDASICISQVLPLRPRVDTTSAADRPVAGVGAVRAHADRAGVHALLRPPARRAGRSSPPARDRSALSTWKTQSVSTGTPRPSATSARGPRTGTVRRRRRLRSSRPRSLASRGRRPSRSCGDVNVVLARAAVRRSRIRAGALGPPAGVTQLPRRSASPARCTAHSNVATWGCGSLELAAHHARDPLVPEMRLQPGVVAVRPPDLDR